jgi:hypothetical protein
VGALLKVCNREQTKVPTTLNRSRVSRACAPGAQPDFRVGRTVGKQAESRTSAYFRLN